MSVLAVAFCAHLRIFLHYFCASAAHPMGCWNARKHHKFHLSVLLCMHACRPRQRHSVTGLPTSSSVVLHFFKWYVKICFDKILI